MSESLVGKVAMSLRNSWNEDYKYDIQSQGEIIEVTEYFTRLRIHSFISGEATNVIEAVPTHRMRLRGGWLVFDNWEELRSAYEEFYKFDA